MKKRWFPFHDYCIDKLQDEKTSPEEWYSSLQPWAEGVVCPYGHIDRAIASIEKSLPRIEVRIEATRQGIFAANISLEGARERAEKTISNLQQQKVAALVGK